MRPRYLQLNAEWLRVRHRYRRIFCAAGSGFEPADMAVLKNRSVSTMVGQVAHSNPYGRRQPVRASGLECQIQRLMAKAAAAIPL